MKGNVTTISYIGGYKICSCLPQCFSSIMLPSVSQDKPFGFSRQVSTSQTSELLATI